MPEGIFHHAAGVELEPLFTTRFMKLRNHPQMNYRGLPNWPPVWTRISEGGVKTLMGEVGVLENVTASQRIPNKCYLIIRYEGERYVGCVAFSDRAFCRLVATFFSRQIGRRVDDLGDLDISRIL